MAVKSITRVAVLFLLTGFLTCQSASAQENVLKVDLFSSAFGNYNLSYERVVNKTQAFNLNLSLMPEQDLFKFGARAFDTYSEIEIANQISGYSVSPEYRFYFGKNNPNSPRGFYLAPYIRASDYKIMLHDTFEDHNTQVDVDLFTTGFGVQLGAHWIFSDTYSLDLQFFGTGVDRHHLKLDYSTKEQGVNFKRYGASVEENNADLIFFGSRMKTDTGDDYIKATSTTFLPAGRGRLTFGIAF